MDKLLELRKTKFNATILDLFEEPDKSDSVYSVKLTTAMKRVAIMLKISELLENSELGKNIITLNKYRNKIVHYSVSLEYETIHSLITKTIEKFLLLLENNVKHKQFIKDYFTEVRFTDIPIRSSFEGIAKNVQDRVVKLMSLFDGQKISGALFSLSKKISLPKFENESSNIISENFCKLVIESETLDKKKWVVIIQRDVPDQRLVESLCHTVLMLKLNDEFQQEKTIIWVINFSGQHLIKNEIYDSFNGWNVLISDQGNFQKLEEELNN